MQITHLRHAVTKALVVVAAVVAGCASVAVSNDAIENNTAAAIGAEKGTFTISDRVEDGVKSSYAVKTNTGKKYSCYVTGSITVVGRVVSDAVCNEAGRPVKQVPAVSGASCNALLKAAGKCQ